uniref:DUF7027 domain-containing protein n=1 Tax=Anopheles farauti TaxID=69004 RepID=A0A182QX41_9DIPT
MDKYLRCFIKYQSYTIVSFTITMVIGFTPYLAENKPKEIEDLRFGGTMAVAFGLSWAIAVLCLIIAIQREDKRFIYPYVFVFGLDLTLMVLREFYLIIIEEFYIQLMLLKILVAAIAIPYVFGSLFALHRLFTIDPKSTTRVEGFVRFDRNETIGVDESQLNAVNNGSTNHVTPMG